MKVIWKYPLLAPLTRIEMASSAKPLHVHEQGGAIYLWVKLDPDDTDFITRTFVWIGTGNAFPDGGDYLGTVHVDPFVWHVYEVSE